MDTENLTHGKESGSKQQLLPTIIAVVALAVALFAIAAPQGGQAAPAASDDSFGRIVQEGKITACYVVWPPSVIKDPNTGQLSGFVIDIFEKIADDAKLQVNYVESTWGGFPADLNAGKCDVAVAGIYPLISRSIAVSFTKPYLYAGSSAVVRSEDTRFKTLEDLNQEGVRVAAVQGEYGHLYAQKYLPKATLVILEKDASPTMPLAAVSSGQADVGFSMADVVGGYAKDHPEVRNMFPVHPFSADPTSLAVRSDDQELKNFLDNGLDYLQSKGYVEAAVKKYNASYWYKADVQYVEVK